MADLSSIQATDAVRVVGSNSSGLELTPVRSSGSGDLGSVDTCNVSGLSGTIALTTVAVELKVGVSRLTDRKYIWLQALDNNIFWGFAPGTCVFPIFKNQLLSFPIGNTPIYAVMSTGTGNIAFGEGA